MKKKNYYIFISIIIMIILIGELFILINQNRELKQKTENQTFNLKENSWIGKKIYCIGDSITANTNGWLPIVKENLGLSSITNGGSGGTTLANNGQEKWFGTMIPSTLADYDAVYIMGGSNDFAQAIPLGNVEYNGSYNTTTFKGAIAYLIEQIQKLAPKTMIIFGTPCNGRGKEKEIQYQEQTNAINLKMSDYANAMIEVGQIFGIPIIDVYGTCGINGLNRLQYIEDKVHPNLEGQQLLARCVTNGLLTYQNH